MPKINIHHLLRKPTILIAVLFLHLFLLIKLNDDGIMKMRPGVTPQVRTIAMVAFVPVQKVAQKVAQNADRIPSPAPLLKAEQKRISQSTQATSTRLIAVPPKSRTLQPALSAEEPTASLASAAAAAISNKEATASAELTEAAKIAKSGTVINYAMIKNMTKATAHELEGKTSPLAAVNGEINRKLSRDEKLANDIDKAHRGDCLTEHQGAGLFAVLFVAHDTLTGKGCKF